MNITQKIAVINANEDIVEAIRLIFDTHGYTTVGAHLIDFKRGRMDFSEFIKTECPDAIVLDIAPPYEENWRYYKLLKQTKVARNIPFIISTTNEDLLKEAAGNDDLDTVEILGKPFDLHVILEKVERALNKTNALERK